MHAHDGNGGLAAFAARAGTIVCIGNGATLNERSAADGAWRMYNEFEDLRSETMAERAGSGTTAKTDLHHSHFEGAAQTMVNAYLQVARQGMPVETVAAAMLGATINMYDFFGMRAALPAMLRAIAESIEAETPHH